MGAAQESHGFVYRERLERVLKRPHPLQPPQNLRNQVEVDKRLIKRHLVGACQRGRSNKDTTEDPGAQMNRPI